MTSLIADISQPKAARIVGIALVSMFFLAILVDEFALSNLIAPGGDAAKLASDIKASEMRFSIAVAGYLVILMLDATIALALYVILKPANRRLASLTAVLRLVYTAVLAVSLLALVFRFIDVYGYETTKLAGYTFFTAHIFVLGYLVFKSGYVPRSLGVLLIVASFCYEILVYGNSLVPDVLLPIFVVPAAVAELSLGIWFLLRGARMPEMKP